MVLGLGFGVLEFTVLGFGLYVGRNRTVDMEMPCFLLSASITRSCSHLAFDVVVNGLSCFAVGPVSLTRRFFGPLQKGPPRGASRAEFKDLGASRPVTCTKPQFWCFWRPCFFWPWALPAPPPWPPLSPAGPSPPSGPLPCPACSH